MTLGSIEALACRPNSNFCPSRVMSSAVERALRAEFFLRARAAHHLYAAHRGASCKKAESGSAWCWFNAELGCSRNACSSACCAACKTAYNWSLLLDQAIPQACSQVVSKALCAQLQPCRANKTAAGIEIRYSCTYAFSRCSPVKTMGAG